MRFSEISWDDPTEQNLFIEEATELLSTLEEGALQSPPPLDALFRAAHTLKGSGGMLGLTEWVATAHHLEDAMDQVRQGTQPFDDTVLQLTLSTVDLLRAELMGTAPAEMITAEENTPHNGSPTQWVLTWDAACVMPGVRAYQAWQAVESVAPGTVSDPHVDQLGTWEGHVSRLTVPEGTSSDAVRQALDGVDDLSRVEEAKPRELSEPSSMASTTPAVATPREATIRIGAETIERILEGLGELLLDQAQLEHRLGVGADPATRTVLGHMRRRALDLQDTTLRARMLPLDTLFRQYPRAIHDIARKLQKPLRLETHGGETELDRLVMDRLHEPLLHLLRNACDHGIEPPAVRRAAGKPETGTIRLVSYAAQGHVHVRVEDDGAGIDWNRLRQKAVAKGWLTSEEAEHASEATLADLLFRPGISTADAITDLSGRGVGLDAVRSFLDAIHGTISVESRRGQGTAFHLELPMTMAIMTALLVDAGPWTVGLPILTVERIEEADHAGLATVLGQPAVPDADAPLPVYPLAQLLDPTAVSDSAGGFLVRVRDGRTQAALAVDQVRGQQEVVVKPVAPLAPVTPWLSGVALLGDGRLALMLDIRRLVPAQSADHGLTNTDGILRPGSNQMELLVFHLSDGQRYGINVYKTREVLPTPAITAVPGQHNWLLGFLRLRGQTVPVVNLHRALGLPEPTEVPLALITEFNQLTQAFLVDSVDRMDRVSWEQVEPLPTVLGSATSESRCLTGLIDHPELGPIQLIDFEQILAQVSPPEFPPPSAVGHPDGVKGQEVWLADDSRVARHQVEKALEPLGVIVRSFEDGQTLWDAVEAGNTLPQLFVLDVEMPRLDGYTLTHRLKQEPRTRALPVLLHTSLSGHWHAERAAQVEADAIVTKFVPEMLARTVHGLLLPHPDSTSEERKEVTVDGNSHRG